MAKGGITCPTPGVGFFKVKSPKLALVIFLFIFVGFKSFSEVKAQTQPVVGADLELVPDSLDYSAPTEPNFTAGEKIKIVVMVKNTGTKKLNPVDVEFYVDDQSIGEVEVGALLPGEQKLAVIFWTPINPGQFNIHAVADPRRLFDERDEGNNRLDRSITVGS